VIKREQVSTQVFKTKSFIKLHERESPDKRKIGSHVGFTDLSVKRKRKLNKTSDKFGNVKRTESIPKNSAGYRLEAILTSRKQSKYTKKRDNFTSREHKFSSRNAQKDR